MTKFLTPRVRKYVFRVLTAGAPLAAFYGLVSDESLPLILGFAAAVLGVGGEIAEKRKTSN